MVICAFVGYAIAYEIEIHKDGYSLTKRGISEAEQALGIYPAVPKATPVIQLWDTAAAHDSSLSSALESHVKSEILAKAALGTVDAYDEYYQRVAESINKSSFRRRGSISADTVDETTG